MSPDDIASDLELATTANAILAQRSQNKPLSYTGYCQNNRCGADLDTTKRFCDAECRDEHDFTTRMRQRQGRN